MVDAELNLETVPRGALQTSHARVVDEAVQRLTGREKFRGGVTNARQARQIERNEVGGLGAGNAPYLVERGLRTLQRASGNPDLRALLRELARRHAADAGV